MSIRLEHVSYAYEDNSSKKNYALKDINLEIKKEEFIAVIGHTGSGYWKHIPTFPRNSRNGYPSEYISSSSKYIVPDVGLINPFRC